MARYQELVAEILVFRQVVLSLMKADGLHQRGKHDEADLEVRLGRAARRTRPGSREGIPR